MRWISRTVSTGQSSDCCRTTPIRSRNARSRASGVEAEHGHRAAVALPVALQDLDGRRLAGSVRPQQAEDLARGDLEVDPANRLDAVVRLPQSSDRDRASRKLDLGECGGSEVAVPGAERVCDLRAVRLVADDDDRGAGAFDGCEDVLGRGARVRAVRPRAARRRSLSRSRPRSRGRGGAGSRERRWVRFRRGAHPVLVPAPARVRSAVAANRDRRGPNAHGERDRGELARIRSRYHGFG